MNGRGTCLRKGTVLIIPSKQILQSQNTKLVGKQWKDSMNVMSGVSKEWISPIPYTVHIVTNLVEPVYIGDVHV